MNLLHLSTSGLPIKNLWIPRLLCSRPFSGQVKTISFLPLWLHFQNLHCNADVFAVRHSPLLLHLLCYCTQKLTCGSDLTRPLVWGKGMRARQLFDLIRCIQGQGELSDKVSSPIISDNDCHKWTDWSHRSWSWELLPRQCCLPAWSLLFNHYFLQFYLIYFFNHSSFLILVSTPSNLKAHTLLLIWTVDSPHLESPPLSLSPPAVTTAFHLAPFHSLSRVPSCYPCWFSGPCSQYTSQCHLQTSPSTETPVYGCLAACPSPWRTIRGSALMFDAVLPPQCTPVSHLPHTLPCCPNSLRHVEESSFQPHSFSVKIVFLMLQFILIVALFVSDKNHKILVNMIY